MILLDTNVFPLRLSVEEFKVRGFNAKTPGHGDRQESP